MPTTRKAASAAKQAAPVAAAEVEEDLWDDEDAKQNGETDTEAEELDSMLDDEDDLLDDIDEDDSEGWVPTEVGEGIQGVVTKVGETKSDFSDDVVPTVTVLTRDGEKYRIIGYSSVLRRELTDAKCEVGDTLAVKFFGEKPVKNGKYAGKPYKHFGVAVRRAQKSA